MSIYCSSMEKGMVCMVIIMMYYAHPHPVRSWVSLLPESSSWFHANTCVYALHVHSGMII